MFGSLVSRTGLTRRSALNVLQFKSLSNKVSENLVSITFVDHEGKRYPCRALKGTNLVEAARSCGVVIETQCNGEVSCPTCHVVVPAEVDLPVASQYEDYALSFANDRAKRSRLGCLFTVDKFDGTIVYVPKLTPW
eukprot:c4654_g1_i1.p1 GENE.c4654_g1_i1~~c4654_g1_i1.p1  ORF type:complete len:136 (+),score=33.42 c4654_g1_i1:46-453(+)